MCQTPLLFKELVSDAMMPFESSSVGGGRAQLCAGDAFLSARALVFVDQPSTALLLCSLPVSAEFQLNYTRLSNAV